MSDKHQRQEAKRKARTEALQRARHEDEAEVMMRQELDAISRGVEGFVGTHGVPPEQAAIYVVNAAGGAGRAFAEALADDAGQPIEDWDEYASRFTSVGRVPVFLAVVGPEALGEFLAAPEAGWIRARVDARPDGCVPVLCVTGGGEIIVNFYFFKLDRSQLLLRHGSTAAPLSAGATSPPPATTDTGNETEMIDMESRIAERAGQPRDVVDRVLAARLNFQFAIGIAHGGDDDEALGARFREKYPDLLRPSVAKTAGRSPETPLTNELEATICQLESGEPAAIVVAVIAAENEIRGLVDPPDSAAYREWGKTWARG